MYLFILWSMLEYSDHAIQYSQKCVFNNVLVNYIKDLDSRSLVEFRKDANRSQSVQNDKCNKSILISIYEMNLVRLKDVLIKNISFESVVYILTFNS